MPATVCVPVISCWTFRVILNSSDVTFRAVGKRLRHYPFLWLDLQTGITIVVTTIVTFLALLSFVDFLRWHWEEDALNALNAEEPPAPEEMNGMQENDQNADAILAQFEQNNMHENDQNADAIMAQMEQNHMQAQDRFQHVIEHKEDDDDDNDNAAATPHIIRERTEEKEERRDEPAAAEELQAGMEDNLDLHLGNNHNELENEQVADDMLGVPMAVGEGEDIDDIDDDWDPDFDDDFLVEDDMPVIEINVALDELLGLSGSLRNAIRNASWLLIFVSISIGICWKLPMSVGRHTWSLPVSVHDFGLSFPRQWQQAAQDYLPASPLLLPLKTVSPFLTLPCQSPHTEESHLQWKSPQALWHTLLIGRYANNMPKSLAWALSQAEARERNVALNSVVVQSVLVVSEMLDQSSGGMSDFNESISAKEARSGRFVYTKLVDLSVLSVALVDRWPEPLPPRNASDTLSKKYLRGMKNADDTFASTSSDKNALDGPLNFNATPGGAANYSNDKKSGLLRAIIEGTIDGNQFRYSDFTAEALIDPESLVKYYGEDKITKMHRQHDIANANMSVWNQIALAGSSEWQAAKGLEIPRRRTFLNIVNITHSLSALMAVQGLANATSVFVGWTLCLVLVMCLGLALAGARKFLEYQGHESESLIVFEKLIGSVDAVLAVAKVTVLFLIKMVVFPLFLGIVIDFSSLTLFDLVAEERLLQIVAHPVTVGIVAHWVVGIAYMLLVTVAILQLKDIMHPDVLRGLVRTPDPQQNLLLTFLEDTVATHTRRMVLSSIVYLVIISGILMIPMHGILYLHRKGVFGALPPRLQTRYYFFGIQVGVEFVGLHLVLLASIEFYKRFVGRLQLSWLKRFSRMFGLYQYLMPVKEQEIVQCKCGVKYDLNETTLQLCTKPGCLLPLPRPAKARDIFAEANRNKEEIEKIAARLQCRPDQIIFPEKDDERTEEENAKLQPLYPRVRPRWLLTVRLILLVICAWITSALMVLAFAAFIILSARVPIWAFRIPVWLQHEPYVSALFMTMFVICMKAMRSQERRVKKELRRKMRKKIDSLVKIEARMSGPMADKYKMSYKIDSSVLKTFKQTQQKVPLGKLASTILNLGAHIFFTWGAICLLAGQIGFIFHAISPCVIQLFDSATPCTYFPEAELRSQAGFDLEDIARETFYTSSGLWSIMMASGEVLWQHLSTWEYQTKHITVGLFILFYWLSMNPSGQPIFRRFMRRAHRYAIYCPLSIIRKQKNRRGQEWNSANLEICASRQVYDGCRKLSLHLRLRIFNLVCKNIAMLGVAIPLLVCWRVNELLMVAYLNKAWSEEHLFVCVLVMCALYMGTNFVRLKILPYVFWQVKLAPAALVRVKQFLIVAHDALRDERYERSL